MSVACTQLQLDNAGHFAPPREVEVPTFDRCDIRAPGREEAHVRALVARHVASRPCQPAPTSEPQRTRDTDVSPETPTPLWLRYYTLIYDTDAALNETELRQQAWHRYHHLSVETAQALPEHEQLERAARVFPHQLTAETAVALASLDNHDVDMLLASNQRCPIEAQELLAEKNDLEVVATLARNPHCDSGVYWSIRTRPDADQIETLGNLESFDDFVQRMRDYATSGDPRERIYAATSPATPPDVLNYLATECFDPWTREMVLRNPNITDQLATQVVLLRPPPGEAWKHVV